MQILKKLEILKYDSRNENFNAVLENKINKISQKGKLKKVVNKRVKKKKRLKKSAYRSRKTNQ